MTGTPEDHRLKRIGILTRREKITAFVGYSIFFVLVIFEAVSLAVAV
jgi:hypothetical protein